MEELVSFVDIEFPGFDAIQFSLVAISAPVKN